MSFVGLFYNRYFHVLVCSLLGVTQSYRNELKGWDASESAIDNSLEADASTIAVTGLQHNLPISSAGNAEPSDQPGPAPAPGPGHLDAANLEFHAEVGHADVSAVSPHESDSEHHGLNSSGSADEPHAHDDGHHEHCHFNPDDPFRCLETDEDKALMKNHMRLRASAAVGVAGLLILLTYVFEYGVHETQRQLTKHRAHLMPLFSHLLQELTILGFIATVLWMMVNFRVFDLCHAMILGKPPPEYNLAANATHDFREGHVVNEFVVLVEEFHYIIFKVMIAYLLLTVGIAVRMEIQNADWRAFEAAPPRVLLTCGEDLGLNCCAVQEMIDYHLLRLEFIRPASPCQGRGKTQLGQCVAGFDVPEWFPFNEYLRLVTSKHISDLLSVPPAGLMGTLLFAPYLNIGAYTTPINQEQQSWEWAIFMQSLCLLMASGVGVLYAIERHLDHVLDELRAPKACVKYRLPLADEDPSTKDVPKKDLLASYQLRERACIKESAPNRLWYGTHEPTRHEQLFVRWRNGPRAILMTVQLMNLTYLVILAMIWRFGWCGWDVPHVLKHFVWFFPIMTVLVVAYVWILMRLVITYMLASSLGEMVDFGTVVEVKNASDRAHISELMSVMMAASASKITGATDKTQAIGELHEVKLSATRKKLHHAVFLFYASGGALRREHVATALRDLGLHCPSESLEHWFKLFDYDQSDTLSMDEFDLLVAGHELLSQRGLDEEQCLKVLEEADANRDGYLSRDELAEVLKKLGISDPEEAAGLLITSINDVEGHRLRRSSAPFGNVTPREVVVHLTSKNRSSCHGSARGGH